ncbi:MAG: LytR/AlgR family response regulator transcription factor [Frankia sp.]
MPKLFVLAVDPDPVTLASLVAALSDDPRVATVRAADDATTALRLARRHTVDAAFVDVTADDPRGADRARPIHSGLELGKRLTRLLVPPALVLVAPTDRQALAAFDLGALDYLVRPVDPERLGRSLARVGVWRGLDEATADLVTLPVEVDGRTVLVHRDEVRFAEARGDYVRLHTDRGTHLVRIPLSRLVLHWSRAEFVRVHRSYLVSLRHVRELREEAEGGVLVSVVVGESVRDLPVSRRHARAVKTRLTGAGRTRYQTR